jgi:dihydrofolate reductase
MKQNTLSLIVAASDNNVIGKNNNLIWRLPTDMKYFKETTSGHCVIMGRKNYESIPEKYRPLSNRTNIIVSRQTNYSAPNCIVVNSIESALAKAREISNDEIFIIGGAQIYEQCFDLADKIYLTRVHATLEGDAFFPALDLNKYKNISSLYIQADTKNEHSFTFHVYEKKKSNKLPF